MARPSARRAGRCTARKRAALDEVNTPNSDASEKIESEDLGQDTFELLRQASANVTKVICGSVANEEERRQLSRVIRGSLYYTSLGGYDAEGAGIYPRSINAETCMYSPYGIGSSVNFVHDYHFRARMTIDDEKLSTLIARPYVRMARTAIPKDRASRAITKDHNGYQKPAKGAVKVINMLGDFEEALFGQTGWLSPLKTFQVVAYAGTVGACGEELLSKGGLDKLKLLKGDTDGKELCDEESALYAQREEKEGSIPMRLLGLAKQR